MIYTANGKFSHFFHVSKIFLFYSIIFLASNLKWSLVGNSKVDSPILWGHLYNWRNMIYTANGKFSHFFHVSKIFLFYSIIFLASNLKWSLVGNSKVDSAMNSNMSIDGFFK